MVYNDFEWTKEIQAGLVLKRNTMYYFPDGDGTFCELTEIINPVHGNIIKWFSEMSVERPGRKLNFFVTDKHLEICGWCDEYKPNMSIYRHNSNLVDIRKLLKGGSGG